MGTITEISQQPAPRSHSPRPSLKEIAQLSGFGKATVSLALRNDPRLRPETRARIQKIAEEVGYRANPVVAALLCQMRSLRTAQVQATLAYLDGRNTVEPAASPGIAATAVSSLTDRAARLGFGMDRLRLHDPQIHPRRLLQVLQARGIVGLVLGNLPGPEPVDAGFDAIWAQFPAVILGVRPSWPPTDSAAPDLYSTVFRAVDKARQLGYRRPGLVIDAAVDRAFENRCSAAYAAAGRSPLAAVPIQRLFSRAGDRASFAQWFSDHRPDVILTSTAAVHRWLADVQVRAPADVGLVHLDLGPTTDGWTGMDQNHAQVGAAAAELLAGRIERNERGLPKTAVSLLIEATWVEGGTTRRDAGRRSRRPGAKPTPAHG